jgi:hypothetical protein
MIAGLGGRCHKLDNSHPAFCKLSSATSTVAPAGAGVSAVLSLVRSFRLTVARRFPKHVFYPRHCAGHKIDHRGPLVAVEDVRDQLRLDAAGSLAF